MSEEGVPQFQQKHNDLIDVVIESSQEKVEFETEEGKKGTRLEINPEIIWWKTQIVASPTFGRFALELKEFERMAKECEDNMPMKRAISVARDIIDIGKSYRASIDASSSISLRDKHNTSSTLIDKINRNKIEKAYTVKGEAKKTLMAGIMGREAERDDD